MRNISKRFGGIQALKSAHIAVKPGEIHALVGENGAGKSTLMRILAGVCHADEGEIYIDGKKVNISDPKTGLQHGVSVIYQEFALADGLSVAENIFINNMKEKGALINWKSLYARARALLEQLNFSQINEKAMVGELSIAYQQVVEICKAMSKNASILVLDEPTALLANREVKQLFRLLMDLRQKGVSIIYISHRLEEIFTICDRVTVLKDGAYVDTVETKQITDKELVRLMVGRELSDYYPVRNARIGDIVFEAKHLSGGNLIKDVNWSVRAGEVLGIGGLVGSGRTETARGIFGADRLASCELLLNGKSIRNKSPKSALQNGIGYLPEDRKNQGVLLNLPIRQNITMSVTSNFSKGAGFIQSAKEIDFANGMAEKLGIRMGGIEDSVKTLSGGNQQKVAIAKVLSTDCRVLIFDEPTRGVDVGSKVEIYNTINQLAEEGYAIIMISSEMQEIIGMCDRAIIMRNGSVAGTLEKEKLTEENIIRFAMGVDDHAD